MSARQIAYAEPIKQKPLDFSRGFGQDFRLSLFLAAPLRRQRIAEQFGQIRVEEGLHENNNTLLSSNWQETYSYFI
jgi:hypothetical protein